MIVLAGRTRVTGTTERVEPTVTRADARGTLSSLRELRDLSFPDAVREVLAT